MQAAVPGLNSCFPLKCDHNRTRKDQEGSLLITFLMYCTYSNKMIANLFKQFGEACNKLDQTINSCVKLDHAFHQHSTVCAWVPHQHDINMTYTVACNFCQFTSLLATIISTVVVSTNVLRQCTSIASFRMTTLCFFH